MTFKGCRSLVDIGELDNVEGIRSIRSGRT